MNLNRTEELEMKRDLGRIRKALEDISDKVVPVSENTQVVVNKGDPFFGKIYMSKEHMHAWDEDFNSTCISLMGLMEECAELQKAASKYYRAYRNAINLEQCAAERSAMIEEMAHVLIDIRMICNGLNISPEEIQQEIYKKYPDGYDVTILFVNNKPYYMERKES